VSRSDTVVPETPATVQQGAACSSDVGLLLGVSRQGNLRASQCTLIDPAQNRSSQSSFTGPEVGGIYFYDLYTVDIPAGAIFRIEGTGSGTEGTRGGLGSARLLAYTTAGAFVANANPLVLNNASASSVRYQILLTTSTAGGTGTYSILANRLY